MCVLTDGSSFRKSALSCLRVASAAAKTKDNIPATATGESFFFIYHHEDDYIRRIGHLLRSLNPYT